MVKRNYISGQFPVFRYWIVSSIQLQAAMNKDDNNNIPLRRRRNPPFGWLWIVWFLFSVSSCPNVSFAFLLPTSSSRIRMRYLNQRQQQEQQQTTSPSSIDTDYESLTVKELRELVRMRSQSDQEKKGLLGKLKRKQEYIDYLVQRDNNKQRHKDSSTGVPDDRTANNNNNPVVRLRQMNTNSNYKSPKQFILDQVYARYFPEQQQEEVGSETLALSSSNQMATALPTGTINGEFEEVEDVDDEDSTSSSSITDIRQLYHPVLRNTPKSSDMDLVFCGTASCMPSVTRGVSCTALRLNWKWSQTSASNQQRKKSSGSSTWLFDVGECTQVRYTYTQTYEICLV